MSPTPRSLLQSSICFLFYLARCCKGENFDFFYLIQEWPGSFCDTNSGCCYPSTGKPTANFSIHGFWPNRNDGSYPSFCDNGNRFNPSLISDLRLRLETSWGSLGCPSQNGDTFWAHEWEKHGTCAESTLDEHDYFQAALNLKEKVDFLRALKNAGINPDGGYYDVKDIRSVVNEAVGKTGGVECNSNASGDAQLYQIYFCVAASDASTIIDCPAMLHDGCPSQVAFPSF